ncbi:MULTISPECIES: glycosyltransferase WbsX family protein [Blautia]|uniref:glycosyltransferase WbsX family protein n=1 Tax=Blautia TaxID=572511 RepID=UPI000BA4C184|nr:MULTISPECIES: glycoside hydrolase family 99-like domain-containing protein [Blautia]
MAKVIALYLPQFHPIPENDEWYGKGFTEWTNVANAKPLFRGHKQPRVPADLGFYDLRVPETRYQQAEMARQYGLDGFAFYHYWFGNGKQLLEKPFQTILEDKKYRFPFMLHWANGSWSKKMWNPNGEGDKLLIEQTYPGEEDAILHFYALLPAFRDERYMRMNDRIMFTVDQPMKSPEILYMFDIWRDLARKEGIGDFFFIAHSAHNEEVTKLKEGGVDALMSKDGLYKGAYDAMIDSQYRKIMYNDLTAKAKFIMRKKLGLPNVYEYKDAIKCAFGEYDKDVRVFPEVFPRFDHSPRSNGKELIYINDTPELFGEYMSKALDIIKDKPEERQLVYIRAWNEWGEGNYLEPDLDSGLGYLEAIRKAVNEFK